MAEPAAAFRCRVSPRGSGYSVELGGGLRKHQVVTGGGGGGSSGSSSSRREVMGDACLHPYFNE